jgi:hypothetical protein
MPAVCEMPTRKIDDESYPWIGAATALPIRHVARIIGPPVREYCTWMMQIHRRRQVRGEREGSSGSRAGGNLDAGITKRAPPLTRARGRRAEKYYRLGMKV